MGWPKISAATPVKCVHRRTFIIATFSIRLMRPQHKPIEQLKHRSRPETTVGLGPFFNPIPTQTRLRLSRTPDERAQIVRHSDAVHGCVRMCRTTDGTASYSSAFVSNVCWVVVVVRFSVCLWKYSTEKTAAGVGKEDNLIYIIMPNIRMRTRVWRQHHCSD